MIIINKMRMKLIFIPVLLLQALFASAAIANITPIISTYLLSDSATETNTSILLSFCSQEHGEELWQSDGTDAGTTELMDINPFSDHFTGEPYSSNPLELTDVNGTIFFQADTGLNDGDGNGKELWKSDGTKAGTMMVENIDLLGNSSPRILVNVNGTLFFVADSATYGTELWMSDGTPGGTDIVANIRDDTPGASSNPTMLTNSGGTLFFQANDGTGNKIWKHDGDGTVNVDPDILNPQELADVDGILFFRANGIGGDRLYISDGTDTDMLGIINSLSNPTRLTNVNRTLFFAGVSGNDNELWKSDGTDGGTIQVMNIRSSGSSAPNELININGTLYFSANDGVNGIELWKSNDDGTDIVKDIFPGPESSNPIELTNVNGTLFFIANGNELWKSDKTNGAVLVKSIPVAGDTNPYELQSHNGLLFFKINNNDTEELWISDGTELGTKRINIKVGCVVPEEPAPEPE